MQFHTRLIADDRYTIEETIRELVDRVGCDLVFTTGGTGPSRRDVTPEATLAVGTRELPGFADTETTLPLQLALAAGAEPARVLTVTRTLPSWTEAPTETAVTTCPERLAVCGLVVAA